MRDRVEKREDASSRMELTGLLHVYFKIGYIVVSNGNPKSTMAETFRAKPGSVVVGI